MQSEQWKGQTSAFKTGFLVLGSRMLPTVVLPTVKPESRGHVEKHPHLCKFSFLSQIWVPRTFPISNLL